MDLLEAIVLGIIQGLTEFLPVSSSGHLEIGKYLFGVDAENSFSFSVVVHGATVLSTIVVFWNEIVRIFRGVVKFKMNSETEFALKIGVSLIPIIIIGFLLDEQIESLFNGNIVFVGLMLLVTALLLIVSSLIKKGSREITYLDSFIIGIAQAFAVLPGVSRSGATISTGILLGNKKENLAEFSFLMVLIPVIGANFVELVKGEFSATGSMSAGILIAGFISAFVTGYLACKWMISIVRKGKLHWFGIYCLIIGLVAILMG